MHLIFDIVLTACSLYILYRTGRYRYAGSVYCFCYANFEKVKSIIFSCFNVDRFVDPNFKQKTVKIKKEKSRKRDFIASFTKKCFTFVLVAARIYFYYFTSLQHQATSNLSLFLLHLMQQFVLRVWIRTHSLYIFIDCNITTRLNKIGTTLLLVVKDVWYEKNKRCFDRFCQLFRVKSNVKWCKIKDRGKSTLIGMSAKIQMSKLNWFSMLCLCFGVFDFSTFFLFFWLNRQH